MTHEQEEAIKKALEFLKKMAEEQAEKIKLYKQQQERERIKQIDMRVEESFNKLQTEYKKINDQILKDAENAKPGEATASVESIKPEHLKALMKLTEDFFADYKKAQEEKLASNDPHSPNEPNSPNDPESKVESMKLSIENDPLLAAANAKLNETEEERDKKLSKTLQDPLKKKEQGPSLQDSSSSDDDFKPKMNN